MTTLARVLETRYHGVRFRSRREARWAVVFDCLREPWEYEPEGYQLPSGNYLPDFVLPALGLFWEVKSDEQRRADPDIRWFELVEATGRDLVVAYGIPDPDDDGLTWGGDGDTSFEIVYYNSAEKGGAGWDNGHFLVRCCRCHRLGIAFSGWCERAGCGCFPDPERHRDYHWDADIQKAYAAARLFRFYER